MIFSVDTQHPVVIPSDGIHLDGILHIPNEALGLVLFVHGSGSSRFSIRNQQVARILNEARFATLLFDLLTPEEEKIDSRTAEFRFDIEFLAARLMDATDWCKKEFITHDLMIGYFGASTGAAAALISAAAKSNIIKAVVSRGGRPDLGGESLAQVKAPTLLIVGGEDTAVIEMNENAMKKIQCIKKLAIVPGATHLFEEPGTLDKAATLARSWFLEYLASSK